MTGRQINKQCGMTLLEVLIALAIFAITMTALLSALTGLTGQQTQLVQKTFAHYVAQNRLAEARLAEQWPSEGVTRGSAEMANQEWFWVQTVKPTSNDTLRRVEIEVRLDESRDNALVQLVGFIGEIKEAEADNDPGPR